MSEVRISGLRKSFGHDLVLAGVDLVVEDKSLTAVLGPSGSGKTTLLRVLAGFVRSDSGRIEVGDETIVDGGFHLPPERRHIGYVPQEGALFPHLDVARNVAFGMKRSPGRDERVKEILELVGMSRYHARYPHELSGGQQQRVALARALAPNPRSLLLDEPFSSLDAQMRTALRLEVAELLHTTETTSVLVTHDQDEAMSIADHVAILARGEVLQSGSPRTLYTRPLGRGIARFVGIANFLFGEISADGVRTEFGLLGTQGGEQIANGSRVVVMVRPERLEIDALEDDADGGRADHRGTTGIEGHVTNLEYHGHDVLVFVEPNKTGLFYQRVPRAVPGETVRPVAPTTRLVVRADGDVEFEPGQKVCVRANGPVAVWPDPALGSSY